MHPSIQKWASYTTWWLDNLAFWWTDIWQSFHSEKERYYLWQILYWSPTTNKWHFPQLPNNHLNKECKRCKRGLVDSVENYFYKCYKVQPIWQWATYLALLMMQSRLDPLNLSVTQALIGEHLDDHCPRARLG